MSDRAPDWLSVAEARERILASVQPLPAETLPLERCLGRSLAEAVHSPIDLPPWDNSGMDGFAVRAEDIAGASPERPLEIRVLEDVPAGGFPRIPLERGLATRVMTGAPVPRGANSVVRVEHTDGGAGIGQPGARVRIHSDEDAWRNIRRRGEDLRAGATVLGEGEVLRPAAIGAAAAVGRSRLRVRRVPLVAIASSGNELVEVDRFAEVIAGRKIVASNGYTLAAQSEEAGVQVRRLGIAEDDPEALRQHLLSARGCDALITSAGISVGAHDHTRRVLDQLGAEVEFWRVKMKPGSPFAFGRIESLGGIPWFGLPGNPVSAMVTFELFVRPALLRMAGHREIFRPTIEAHLAERFQSRPGLTHFLRVRLDRDGERYVASLTGAQGSGILTSMVAADGLFVIPEAQAGVEAGGAGRVIQLHGAPLTVRAGY